MRAADAGGEQPPSGSRPRCNVGVTSVARRFRARDAPVWCAARTCTTQQHC
ncbi:hypothetical protein XMIN_1381 [Xanthomonas citri pv. mangiferaeindicae LMG 941]|nr:hypothetical protein XAPC_1304 [Xanthomonas citri pv. punicae str. LMG 859]CCG36409.1 hypothetical protein XMIN_1381 [Xanthomonas citri pv. mangiferaeindicae LMG 941]